MLYDNSVDYISLGVGEVAAKDEQDTKKNDETTLNDIDAMLQMHGSANTSRNQDNPEKDGPETFRSEDIRMLYETGYNSH